MEDTPVKVLLIDDDEDYVSVVGQYVRTFQHRKFDLHWVPDGEKALKKLSGGERYDMILMDYYLPKSNGLEWVKKIHELNLNIPIVLLTANKDFRIAIEAMKFGVEEYLVKDEVVETILPRTIVNVLERLQLKKKVLEAERLTLVSQKETEAKQELVVTMCHEFNNPLAAIKISADILSRQSVDDHQKEMLRQLNESITKLEQQIVKLRDLNVGQNP
jgi:DNA-binding NtrC family response regulator